jgi:hypothetical protein
MEGGAAPLDRSRLDAIATQLGETAADVAATLRSELGRALADIDAGLAAAAPEAVALAAHAARNSALMIAAGPTLAALDELERAARADDLKTAAVAAGRLRQRWPPLRAQLERITESAR